MRYYIGTYTRDTSSEGIYCLELAEDLSGYDLKLAATADNPSWLISHPGLPVVYAVNEVGDFENGGAVTVFDIDVGGRLREVQQVPTHGADPCHLRFDAGGRLLICTNYSSGSITTFMVDADGGLGRTNVIQHRGEGPDPVRQGSAHTHSSLVIGNRVHVADLGSDSISVYEIREGELLPDPVQVVSLPPGAGPRHMVVSPGSGRVFCICELDNTIVTMAVDAKGRLVPAGRASTLPDEFSGRSFTAEIAISADGQYVYGSNRGHDSIAVLAAGMEGELKQVQIHPTGGSHPRHFLLDEEILIVANRDSHNLVVFRRNAQSGVLEDTGFVIEMPAPVCVLQI